MFTQLKQLGARSRLAIICWHIYNNWKTKRRFRAGKLTFTSGSTHTGMTLSESLGYIDSVFDDYLTYADITIDMLKDKRILELGPGDNVGVALKFLAAGAKQVVCLDKFFSNYEWQQQRKIYQALRNQLKQGDRPIFDEVIDLEKGIRVDSRKLIYLYGSGIEEAEKVLEPESFDLIISRAVLEHLYDTDTAFSVMDSLLKSGGLMLHKIDFRDHGMFSAYKYHPLTFLTVPHSVYKLMTYDSGKPNRKLINYYRRRACELGYSANILITHIVGRKDEVIPHKEKVLAGSDYSDVTLSLLKSIRPRLQPEFNDISDEELMTSGIFLVMRKS